MTTIETRMSVIYAILMMAGMGMLISVMLGIVDADSVRSPIQAIGCAVALYPVMFIMKWLRSKTKPV